MLKRSQICWLLLLAGGFQSTQALEFKDNDKIAFLGNTFIERAQKYGYIETAITAANPDKNLTFRNLGWSGDTVFGHSRSYFGPPKEGFERLQKLIEEEKPTLMLLNYGANASYEGEAGVAKIVSNNPANDRYESEAGIEKFIAGYERLIQMLQKASPDARIALLTPLPQEGLVPSAPGFSDKALRSIIWNQNRKLSNYRNAIVKLGMKHGFEVVDLFKAFGEGKQFTLGNAGVELTNNGIHLSESGYWLAVPYIQSAFGQSGPHWTYNYDKKQGEKVEITIHPKKLPCPTFPKDLSRNMLKTEFYSKLGQNVQIKNLPLGRWKLSTKSGRTLKIAEAKDWAAGIPLYRSNMPDAQQAEQLRQVIIQKNRLFFHKHRPQNETYLFGFRKHEQGNNAAEIPKFQPLIEAKEKEIAKLRVPQPFTLILSKE